MHMEEGLLDDDVFQPDYIELSPTPKTKKKNVIHKNRVSRPVLLANIETHYDWLKADSEHRLMEEYDDIQAVGSIVRMDQATNAEVNKTKNRFNKILPYEHSRVKLMALKGKSETDYINANYIPGFNSPREYIACQGPLPETTNDMWRMIWEKKSTIIVMMTKTVEGGKDKCHQYWPKKKGRSDTYGGSLEVSLQSELDYEHWITRTFMLQKNKMKREVIQLQFTSWPDHGVPEQTKPMLDFVKNVRERIRNKCVIKPVIVHCSAGVGRTGTYIALDRLTQHMEDNDFVDVCGVVCEMRMHRNYLVQTETQYIFIHDCLMDYFCSGVAP
ncbi:receptor-type tyrosine-protein phosphatase eta [Strongylocentrotus purpuratus]|uniref:Uncharacterized protein n=1 Tax=Strongylocentrotus purpuratus TaxID=7668 RepID=A0A7M7T4B9_STRPU|nr:receptor-type tyrosine-protein phosphatase eta [Strongylocentrotus purpuratus]